MRFFNILGSLIFFAIGYMVLIQGQSFFLTNREIYTYSSFLGFAYIGTQGIGLLFRKPGKQSGFYMDLIFSIPPLFLVYESFARSVPAIESYSFFQITYLLAVILDLVIFTAVAYRFAIMADEYIVHD